MLYDLEPTDDLTGGPWYTESKSLDEPFVNALLDVVLHVVDKHSYPTPKKITLPDGKIQLITRFYEPTYRGYATAEDVYENIINSKILQDDVKETFGVSQVHQLLEVACINKQIQKRTDGITYRSLLPDDSVLDPEELDVYYNKEEMREEDADIMLGHKGYTEAPCGKCPVFKICGDPGEEVSASNCVYWDEWTAGITPVEYF
jgi:DNA-directed RNA polymerase III subunit RPC6